MPLYQYRCLECQQSAEIQAKMADPPPTRLPQCSASTCRLVKQLSPVAGFSVGKSTLGAAKEHLSKASELLGRGRPAETHTSEVCGKYCDLHK